MSQDLLTKKTITAEIKTGDYEAWNNRGVALDDLGHYEEAIVTFDRALEINPDYHEAWNNQGIALGKLERYREAFTTFNNALAIKPNFHDMD